jgi:peptidoglycan/LPS O-acetylase OafA/YrhL
VERRELPTHEDYLGERYFRPLDGVRAISILLVLTWHVNNSLWAWLSGWEGPSIFFVISGFLITTLCLREEDRDGSVSLKAFYVRRACRILPLYFVVLAVYVVMDIGFDRQGQRGPLLHALPYYLTYMNDFAPNVANLSAPFRLSWTLGVEEKFYLFWPLLGFVLLTRRPRARLVAAALLVAVTLIGYDPGSHYLFYSQIMAGCLIAILLHRRASYDWLQRALRFSSLTLAGVVLAHVLMYRHAGIGQVLFGPAVALALAAIVVRRPSWDRVLTSRPMIYLGKRSYGVYLVNLICLALCVEIARHVAPSVRFDSENQPVAGGWLTSLVMLVAVTATSLLLSEALYRTVEGPLIARGRIWSKQITGRLPVAPPRLAEYGPLEPAPVETLPAEDRPADPVPVPTSVRG